MGDIFCTPIHARHAPRGGLTLLGPVCRIATSTTGIFPAGASATKLDVTIPLGFRAEANVGCPPQPTYPVACSRTPCSVLEETNAGPGLFKISRAFSTTLLNRIHLESPNTS